MKLHRTHVANAFNKAASSYDVCSDIQVKCGKQLIQQLTDAQTQFGNVIDAGCGTGHTTTQLAANIEYDHFIAVDIAESMLPATGFAPDINFLHDDFNHIHQHPIHYDLIFSNLALHWSDDFSSTLHLLHQALNAGGLLAFSIPLQGTFIELTNHFSIHDFKSLDDVRQLLTRHHFHPTSHYHQTLTNAYPDTLSALQSIKKTGTNFVSERRHHGLRGKEFLAQCDIRRLTYNVGFFIAEKQDA